MSYQTEVNENGYRFHFSIHAFSRLACCISLSDLQDAGPQIKENLRHRVVLSSRFNKLVPYYIQCWSAQLHDGRVMWVYIPQWNRIPPPLQYIADAIEPLTIFFLTF